MLITCPYCGPRDLVEFSYQGDANRTQPDPMSNHPQAWTDYVFQRSNAAGPHREFWQHAGGCRAHLVVVRDTTTHEIHSVALARGAVAAPLAEPATDRARDAEPARRSGAARPAPRPRKKQP
jgi:heterotetrameric sarcosine oxidase delta subunit